MDLLNFPHSAYLVTSATKELYDAVPASSPITLTGTAPTGQFKCRCKVSASGTHNDMVGHLYINAEDLNFTSGVTTKQSTTLLTSIPLVTYSGLDCSVLIECLDSGGAPIMAETLTAIKIRFEPTSKMYMSTAGAWTQSQAYAMVVNSTIGINSKIRYSSIDYTVKQVEALNWLDGTELYRILYF